MQKYLKNNTALILIDTYNDMLSEGGKIWPRLKDVAESVNLHENLRQLVSAVRKAGIKVFFSPHRRYRPGDIEGWISPGRAHQALRANQLYAIGTFGGEWHPDFYPKDGDIVCYEHWGMGGFEYTDLDLHLRQHGINNLILAGVTAPGCVEATGRQGMELGYSITLVKDATAAYSFDLMRAAHELNGPLYAESIVTTKELITQLPVE